MSCFHGLKLNCNFLHTRMCHINVSKLCEGYQKNPPHYNHTYLSSGDVNGKINISKWSTAYFSNQTVFLCYDKFGRSHQARHCWWIKNKTNYQTRRNPVEKGVKTEENETPKFKGFRVIQKWQSTDSNRKLTVLAINFTPKGAQSNSAQQPFCYETRGSEKWR